jgi:translation initiation factor 2 gamma subunit (eIF-2gamma)
MNELPKKAKHVFLLRYEQIRDSYDETMKIIQNKFNLIKNENHLSSYKQIPNYKGTYTALYSKKPILLSEEIQEYIRNHVDKEQENFIFIIKNSVTWSWFWTEYFFLIFTLT